MAVPHDGAQLIGISYTIDKTTSTTSLLRQNAEPTEQQQQEQHDDSSSRNATTENNQDSTTVQADDHSTGSAVFSMQLLDGSKISDAAPVPAIEEIKVRMNKGQLEAVTKNIQMLLRQLPE